MIFKILLFKIFFNSINNFLLIYKVKKSEINTGEVHRIYRLTRELCLGNTNAPVQPQTLIHPVGAPDAEVAVTLTYFSYQITRTTLLKKVEAAGSLDFGPSLA